MGNADDYQEGIHFVTGHDNGSVALWDLDFAKNDDELALQLQVEEGRMIPVALRVVIPSDHRTPVTALSLSTDQRHLAIGYQSGHVRHFSSVETTTNTNNNNNKDGKK